MKIKSRGKIYEYENMVHETVKISKVIRDEFNKYCKEKGIIKSRLIEEFYQDILTKKDDIEILYGNMTFNIFQQIVRKRNRKV